MVFTVTATDSLARALCGGDLVAQGERAFQQMLEQARCFAEVLPGVLVDDNHQTLSEDSLEPIRRQIAQFQNMMAEQNIPAGSASALRLFS